MKLTFEVVRNRISTTQGSATVLCNGQELIRFGDDIRLKEGGGWESVISDAELIAAALFPCEEVKHFYPEERVTWIEQKIKSVLGVTK